MKGLVRGWYRRLLFIYRNLPMRAFTLVCIVYSSYIIALYRSGIRYNVRTWRNMGLL
jgi:hypothetical protein